MPKKKSIAPTIVNPTLQDPAENRRIGVPPGYGTKGPKFGAKAMFPGLLYLCQIL